MKKHHITFPNALDPEGKISDQFRLTAHPIALFIDAKGQIVGSRIGGTDEKQLKRDFERLF